MVTDAVVRVLGRRVVEKSLSVLLGEEANRCTVDESECVKMLRRKEGKRLRGVKCTCDDAGNGTVKVYK